MYVISGPVAIDGVQLRTGDAGKITRPADLNLATDVAAELSLIDVPLQLEPVRMWAGER